MKGKAPQIVLVEWIDSHSGDGWMPLDELREKASILYCRSVGFLIEQNRAGLMLVGSISGEKNGNIRLNGTGDIFIPRKCVVKVKVFKAARRIKSRPADRGRRRK